MRARGMRVGVMKPVDTLESQDAQALALAVGSIAPMELICPCRCSSTPAPAPDLSHISRCFDEIAAQNDVVLVESSSTIDFADLAAMLNLEVIVIVGNRPGCLDATTLALRRCESRGIKVAGCILCDIESARAAIERNNALSCCRKRRRDFCTYNGCAGLVAGPWGELRATNLRLTG